MRFLRTLLVFKLGVYTGLAVAAGLMKRALPSRGDASSDELALVAIFDGVQLQSRARAFRGGSMLAWFGGIDVDLREAELAPDARLSVTALCGGIAIRVPEGWRVEPSVKTLAGGVDVEATDGDVSSAPTLRLDGLAAFGGVAVGARPRAIANETT
jgi:hypothetical protein